MLQLHKTDEGTTEYAEFLHDPRKRFTDFGRLIESFMGHYSLFFIIKLTAETHEILKGKVRANKYSFVSSCCA